MADKKIRLLVQAEVKKAVQALNKVEKEQKDIKKQNDGLKKSFAAMGGAIAAAFSIQAIARFTQESIKLGSQTVGLERAFKNLGKAVNFNEQSLDKFRKATDGTVSDIDLMVQANNAMLLGIVENDDQFAELIDNAQRLAQAVGKDAVFGIESLTTGIGRQSKLMLDNLGIIVDTNRAYEIYAESIGKSTSELDDNEKKQAFIQATMESVAKKVNQLGKEQLTASSSTEALSAAFINLQGSIGKELQDEVIIVSGQFTKLIEILNEDIEEKGLLGTLLSGRIPIGLGGIPALFNPIQTAINNLPPIRPKVELPKEADEFLEDMLVGDEGIDPISKMFKVRINASNEYTGIELMNAHYRKEANKAAVKELRREERVAHIDRMADNLQAAILEGQSTQQALSSVLRAESIKATMSLVTKIMQSVPFPANLLVAPAAAGFIQGVTSKVLGSFATGGSFVTNKKTTLPIGNGVVVGDNASGMERIDVTPLPSPSSNGNNINIYISAPLVDETVVDTIIPAIRRAEKLNL